MKIIRLQFVSESITRDPNAETTTVEADLTWDEETVDPTTVTEPVESDNTDPLEPMAQTSVRFDTQVELTVRAVVSWHNQIHGGCSSSQQTYHNYTITYSTLENPEDTKTEMSTAPFILLTDLMPNEDYMYEVTSRGNRGNVLWSGKGHLNTS